MRAFGKKTELQRDIVECKYQLNMHCHMPAPSRSVRRQGEPVRSCRSKELRLTRARGSSPAAPASARAIAQLTTGAAKPPVQAMAAQSASFSLQAQRRAGSRAVQGLHRMEKRTQTKPFTPQTFLHQPPRTYKTKRDALANPPGIPEHGPGLTAPPALERNYLLV